MMKSNRRIWPGVNIVMSDVRIGGEKVKPLCQNRMLHWGLKTVIYKWTNWIQKDRKKYVARIWAGNILTSYKRGYSNYLAWEHYTNYLAWEHYTNYLAWEHFQKMLGHNAAWQSLKYTYFTYKKTQSNKHALKWNLYIQWFKCSSSMRSKSNFDIFGEELITKMIQSQLPKVYWYLWINNSWYLLKKITLKKTMKCFWN